MRGYGNLPVWLPAIQTTVHKRRQGKMLSYHDILIQQERSQELVRHAVQERHLRQILTNRERGNRLFCRALSWIGSRLVTWGRGLQERYGTAATTP